MGLKDYRLWAMGQLDSTCRAPPRAKPAAVRTLVRVVEHAAPAGLHPVVHERPVAQDPAQRVTQLIQRALLVGFARGGGVRSAGAVVGLCTLNQVDP